MFDLVIWVCRISNAISWNLGVGLAETQGVELYTWVSANPIADLHIFQGRLSYLACRQHGRYHMGREHHSFTSHPKTEDALEVSSSPYRNLPDLDLETSVERERERESTILQCDWSLPFGRWWSKSCSGADGLIHLVPAAEILKRRSPRLKIAWQSLAITLCTLVIGTIHRSKVRGWRRGVKQHPSRPSLLSLWPPSSQIVSVSLPYPGYRYCALCPLL